MTSTYKIGEVAAKYKVSNRTLRYYEEIGILKSFREEGSNYRLYNSDALKRLEKILLLRRLDFSINDICHLLKSEDAIHAHKIFQEKLKNIQDEIDGLVSLKHVIKSFLNVSEKVGIENVNTYELLREHIYVHKKVERMINMQEYQGDIIKIEISKTVIPYTNTIIEEIKSLRANFEKSYSKEVPLIRLTDNEELEDGYFRILLRGNIILEKKLNDEELLEEAITITRDLEEVVKMSFQ